MLLIHYKMHAWRKACVKRFQCMGRPVREPIVATGTLLWHLHPALSVIGRLMKAESSTASTCDLCRWVVFSQVEKVQINWRQRIESEQSAISPKLTSDAPLWQRRSKWGVWSRIEEIDWGKLLRRNSLKSTPLGSSSGTPQWKSPANCIVALSQHGNRNLWMSRARPPPCYIYMTHTNTANG